MRPKCLSLSLGHSSRGWQIYEQTGCLLWLCPCRLAGPVWSDTRVGARLRPSWETGWLLGGRRAGWSQPDGRRGPRCRPGG